MFKDHSLLPAEAIRLAALGFLAEGPRRHGDLAAELRHFIGLAVGPSLEMMGSSIELLRHEGLVTAGEGEDAEFALTPAGLDDLTKLLRAPLRAPTNDAGRLALLLKLRFGHHLPAPAQAAQRTVIADALEAEAARLEELRRRFAANAPLFRRWLDRDIAELAGRIADFRGPG